MSNLSEMLELAEYTEDLVVEGSREFMRLYHRATIEPFGKSPGTPVDTGEARAGGRVGLNGPPSFAPSDGDYQPAPIEHVDAATAGMKPGDSLVWATNVEHSPFLDDGKSSQAPEGFTRQAQETACDELERWRFDG